MLGDAGRASSSDSPEKNPKVRMIASASDRGFTEGERELLRTMAKQTLSLEQKTRNTLSLIETHKILTEGKIHVGMKKSMEGLIQAQRRLKDEQSLDGPAIQEKLGAAHCHQWNSIVKTALEYSKEGSPDHQLLQKYVATIKSVKDYSDVRIAKAENMFQSKEKKLLVYVTEKPQEAVVENDMVKMKEKECLTAAAVWPTMKRIFAAHEKGWKQLPGVPPQGALAPKMQRLVDEMPQEMET